MLKIFVLALFLSSSVCTLTEEQKTKLNRVKEGFEFFQNLESQVEKRRSTKIQYFKNIDFILDQWEKKIHNLKDSVDNRMSSLKDVFNHNHSFKILQLNFIKKNKNDFNKN